MFNIPMQVRGTHSPPHVTPKSDLIALEKDTNTANIIRRATFNYRIYVCFYAV